MKRKRKRKEERLERQKLQEALVLYKRHIKMSLIFYYSGLAVLFLPLFIFGEWIFQRPQLLCFLAFSAAGLIFAGVYFHCIKCHCPYCRCGHNASQFSHDGEYLRMFRPRLLKQDFIICPKCKNRIEII